MIPLDVGDKQKRFLLTAVPSHCSFCCRRNPTALVESSRRAGALYVRADRLSGRFNRAEGDSDGLLYRLSDATRSETPNRARRSRWSRAGPPAGPNKTPRE